MKTPELKRLKDNMLDGFAYCKMLYDGQGNPADFIYLDVNRAFEELTGLENVVGRKATEVIPGIKESDSELFEIYGRVASTGRPEKFEIEIEPLRIWFSVSAYCPADGYFVALFDNITGRKQAEKVLIEEKNKAAEILDCIGDGISIQDRDMNIVYQNSTQKKMIGQHIGEHCYSAYEGNENICEGCQVNESFIDGKVNTKERRVNVDGRDIHVEITASPLRNLDGEISSVVEVVRDITSRKKTEEAIKIHALQQAGVAELGQLALVERELSVLFERAVAIVAECLEVEYSKILELLPDASGLLLKSGVGWKDGYVGQAVVGFGADSQAGFTLLSCEPVVVEDLRTEKRFSGPEILVEHGVVSGISVLISGEDRPFGVLGAHSRRRRAFSRDDINFVQSVANVIAAAAEKRKYEITIVQRNEWLAMLNQIDKAMVSTFDLEEIFGILVENLVKALKMESGIVFLYDDFNKAVSIVKNYNFEIADGNACFPLESLPLISEVIKCDKPIILDDVNKETVAYRMTGAKSIMLVPLSVQGMVQGVICLHSKNSRHIFSDAEIEFAKQASDQAMIAIVNAKLVKSLTDNDTKLFSRNRELLALNEVASIIASNQDIGVMLRMVLEMTLFLPFLDVMKGAIFLRDEKDPAKFNMAAHVGLTPCDRITSGECLCGMSAQTGEIVYSSDCYDDPRHTVSYPDIKRHGRVILPIKNKNGVLGVMSYYLEPGTVLPEAEIHLLTSISNQLATGISNHRLLEKITAAKKEWESTFDAMEEMVSIHGTDYTILRANKAVSRYLGREIDKIPGLKCYEVFHGTKEPVPLCPAKELLDGKFPVSREIFFSGKYFEINLYPVFADGQVSSFIHVTKDITRRKKDEKIKAEQARHAMLAAEVGRVLTKADGLLAMLQKCTDAMVRHFGAAFARIWTLNDAENVLELQASSGMYTDIDGPYSRVPVGKFKIGLVAQERMPHLSNEVIGDPKVGDQEWAKREGMVAFAGHPLIVGERLVGVMAMFAKERISESTMSAFASLADVIAVGIERERSADALKESEEQFRNLVEQSLVGVYIIQDEIFRYVNPRFADIFGYTPEETMDIKTPRELVYPEDWPLVRENILKGESGEARHYSFRGLTKKGKIVHVEVHASQIIYLGKIARMGTLIDITETVIARDELVKKTQEAVILKQARMQSEEVNRLKSEFLANMSHELRTPLNAVIGLSQVLLEKTYGPLVVKQEDYLRGINQSGQHLIGLINEILDLSKIEAGKEQIELSDFSLMGLLNNSFIMIKEKALKNNIELVREIDSGVGMYRADERRIKQIIYNLLSNAVKFTNPGGKVGLKASRQDDGVTITVWDTGIGIPENKKHLLFQPFQLIDSSLSRRHEGTGLGLVLTKKLVELHHGRITVESTEGKGASFTVVLPLSGEIAGRKQDDYKTVSEPLCPAGLIAGKKILVVEDNRLNMLLAVDYLKVRGAAAFEAFDGISALEKAYAENPDLILMDIQMPDMDGFEVLQKLRMDPGTSGIPVIAMTALAMKDDREKCLRGGFDDYISKPVNLGEMIDKVHALLMKGAVNE
jgi:PAS domain S-box-containing protein